MISFLLSAAVVFGAAPLPDDGPGVATWYDATRNSAWYTRPPRPGAAARNQLLGPLQLYAAVRGFRWGDRPYRAEVCRRDRPACVVVWVVDYCSCSRLRPGRMAIDLSPQAFAELGPLGRGVLPVTVRALPERKRVVGGAPPFTGRKPGPYMSIYILL